ncbi:MAG: ribosome maturation factor RimP [Lapillicoccus sp.]
MATERLRPAIDGPLARLGLTVQDLTVTPAGRRRVVRVVVDRDLSGLAASDTTSPVPPLSLDEVAEATRVVSDVLDSSALMGEQPYVLEVTSPGVDRPLHGRHQFRRNVGRLVTVVTDGGDGCTGRILSVSGDSVEIETAPQGRMAQGRPVQPPGTPARRLTLTIADISSAVVQVEFTRPDGASGQPLDDGEEAT